MSRQNLNGSDTLNVGYQKINQNFIELYAGVEAQEGAVLLSQLEDVDITLPISEGQSLVYDATANKWENKNIPRQLDDLTDVNLGVGGALAEFQVIQYNGTTWINSKVAVSELSDVTVASPLTGQTLQWNGTNWVNAKVNYNELVNSYVADTGSQNQVIKWDDNAGGSGIAGYVNTALNIKDLGDVSVSAPSANQIIQFNGATNKWQNINTPYAINTSFEDFQLLCVIGGV